MKNYATVPYVSVSVLPRFSHVRSLSAVNRRNSTSYATITNRNSNATGTQHSLQKGRGCGWACTTRACRSKISATHRCSVSGRQQRPHSANAHHMPAVVIGLVRDRWTWLT